MAQVTFEIPDDFVPMKGVCILSGWKEGSPPLPYLYRTHLSDTAEWEKASLCREGLRKADAAMNEMWAGTQ